VDKARLYQRVEHRRGGARRRRRRLHPDHALHVGISIKLMPHGESQLNEQNVRRCVYDSVSVDFSNPRHTLLAGRPSPPPMTRRRPVSSSAPQPPRCNFDPAESIGRQLRGTNPAQRRTSRIVGVVGDVLRPAWAAPAAPAGLTVRSCKRPTVLRPPASCRPIVRPTPSPRPCNSGLECGTSTKPSVP